ncbi:MAG: hypothetical protein JSR79_13915 [Proteobacteria bacterium]|nr:hypothetical protein [Pseudomonadota bacterium]
MLALAVVLALGAASPNQETARAVAARQVLRECGTNAVVLAAAPDANWRETESNAEAHAQLRAELGISVPDGRERILIYGIGGDLETWTHSIVLTRDKSGRWRFDAVGRSRAWIANAKPFAYPPKSGEISAVDGKRIDSILVDPCFLAEPAQLPVYGGGESPPVGATVWTVETAGTRIARRFSIIGTPKSRSGDLLAIVFGYLR